MADAPRKSNTSPLQLATAVTIAAFFLHNGDHARRGLQATTEPVVWAGTALLVLVAVTATLVFTHHPAAPKAAAMTGALTTVGVTLSHLVPHWGPLSDPLHDRHVGAVTYTAVIFEIAAGALLCTVALKQLRKPTHAAAVSTLSLAEQFSADADLTRASDPAAAPRPSSADSARNLEEMQRSAPW